VHYINILWQEQEAGGLLEEEEVDTEPGSQLEDVQADWDTGFKKIRL
jgi:hypothetical protein